MLGMNGISVQNDMMEETGHTDTDTPTADTAPSTKETATEYTEAATEITETLTCTKDTETDTSKTETLTKDTKTLTKDTETDTKDTETVIKDTETVIKDTETVIKDTETDTKDTGTVIKDKETEPKSVIKEPETVITDPKIADSETESETDTSWSNLDTTSSTSGSRKKNQISNCEMLAQMKNRHEEIILNSRLKSLHSKQCREEYSLARTKKQLIETMKISKRTSGLSQNTFVADVTPVIYKYYQTPWAYSFNDTTHNSLYKEIEQLPKRSFKRKGRQSTTRPTVKSASSNQRTVSSLIERSISASNVELNGNSNETLPLLRARRTPIIRPHSCMFPMQAKDTVDKGNVHFHQDTVRPHTSKNDSIMTHRQVERKQSWIKPINRSNSNPITDTRPEEDNNEMTDDEFVSKYLGNSDKVNRYRYLNRKKEGSSQVEYRGQKLKNYIRPQDRYKKDPLNLIRREKTVLKMSMTDSESLEESRNTALKAGEAFPKAARLRMLNELIASNNDRSRGPYLDYNAELQARIEHFLRSIDEFSESRSTSSYETKTGSVHS